MIECSSALGELIRKKKRDEISKIVSFLSGKILSIQMMGLWTVNFWIDRPVRFQSLGFF